MEPMGNLPSTTKTAESPSSTSEGSPRLRACHLPRLHRREGQEAGVGRFRVRVYGFLKLSGFKDVHIEASGPNLKK